MMIIMKADATKEQVAVVIERIEFFGLGAHLSEGEERTVIGAIGDGRPVQQELFLHMPGVDRVLPISRPYKLASREFKPANTIIPVNGVNTGSNQVLIIAGPCAVESRSQLLETAHAVKEAGAQVLRGGAFKPRTSPYSFQGLGEEGSIRSLGQILEPSAGVDEVHTRSPSRTTRVSIPTRDPRSSSGKRTGTNSIRPSKTRTCNRCPGSSANASRTALGITTWYLGETVTVLIPTSSIDHYSIIRKFYR